MTASAKVVIPAVPPPPAQNRITMADEPDRPVRQPASPGIIRNDTRKSNDAGTKPAAAAAAQNIRSTSTSPGSAAAPAPARKLAPPPAREGKTAESERTKPSYYEPSDAATMPGAESVPDAPSFAALNAAEDSRGLGGNKKILIAVAVVLVLATLGYFGYGKLAKSSTATPAPQPVSTPQDSGQQDSGQPAPNLAPMSSPRAAPSPGTSNRASSAPQTPAPGTVAAVSRDMPSPGADNPPLIRIALNPVPGTKKHDSTPLVVRSNPAGPKILVQSQDAAPPSSNLLNAASANNSALNGLMSSASSSFPKPALATPRVSQGVSQGLLIKRVQPRYPPAALAVHTQGAVQIEATINKEGNVINLKVLSGDPVLAHAALEAVRQWRYKPYYLDGEPVEIETQITVNFKAN